MKRPLRKAWSAWTAAALILQPALATAAAPVTLQPATPDIAAYRRDPAADPPLATEQLVKLLREKVKYVFVLFQENRSFDHYFGSFPGANGLFADPDGVARAPADTPGFVQTFYDTDGSRKTISPFRIGQAQHAADLDDIDHGHPRMASKMNLDPATAQPKMDRFAVVEESKYVAGGLGYARSTYNGIPALPDTAAKKPSERAKQFGELTMAYLDCDTVPFLWNYAHHFVLFDDIFQTMIGPSTPNAIAMIAGQSGETEWVKHPGLAIKFAAGGDAGALNSAGVPVVNDPLPGLPGTNSQFSGRPSEPANVAPKSNTAPPPAPQRINEFNAPFNVAPNLTFASLPLSFAGRDATEVTGHDGNPAQDLADLQQDIQALTSGGGVPVDWGWYQNGYAASEPNLPASNGISATPHASYVGHHNGPQYFGYVADNPTVSAHLHGLGNFFDDVAAKKLPSSGGVFYVRGGYDNIAGLAPAFNDGSPDANYVQGNFLGDDDHPGYSDSEISESLVARAVNAIAASPYWGQSAIIITYDESEGDYDHVPPRILSFDPGGLPLSRGPRIPLIVISPFARASAVSHEEGDHASVISLIDAVFGLVPLADLPDEKQARESAAKNPAFNAPDGRPQTNLGPHDDLTPGGGSLLSAFDPARLQGTAPPLPATLAMIPPEIVDALPHYHGQGCDALGITTEDRRLGIVNTVPADFSPRPSQTAADHAAPR